MKKKLLGAALVVFGSSGALALYLQHDPGAGLSRDPVPVAAGKTCTLRYPILLSHHWSVQQRDREDGAATFTEHPGLPPQSDPIDSPSLRGRDMDAYYRYFSQEIVARLKKHGNRVYIADKSPYASNADRARQLRATALRALAETGAAKLNVVGHSQGAQDSRYMISNLHRFDRDDPRFGTPADFPMGSRVASWTGLAGEAQGTGVADLALWQFSIVWDLYRESLLDSDPAYASATTLAERALRAPALKEGLHASLVNLSRDYMQNKGEYAGAGHGFQAPDYPGVFYQSYAARMRRPRSEWISEWPYWAYLKLTEGENDGYTSVRSQSYGELQAVLEGPPGSSGVHHMFFTGRPGKIYAPGGYMTAAGFFEILACDLKDRGF